jgi:multidrug efflux pump subunit AcrA (membrane-fusion protein)
VPIGEQSLLASAQSAHDSAQAAQGTAQAAHDAALAAYNAADEAGKVEAKAALDAARAALDGARTALDRAAAALDRARVAAGPMLARSEVLGMAAVGQQVTAVPAAVGAAIVDPKFALAELDGGPPFVSMLATQNQAGMLQVGLEAAAFDEVSGASAKLRVRSVATEVVTDSGTGQIGYPVNFEFTTEPLNAIGRTIRVEVTPNMSLEEKLAVPVSAVFATADRSTFVTVVGSGGSTTNVPVKSGQSGGGWVEIVPNPVDAVVVGTVVVVGAGG